MAILLLLCIILIACVYNTRARHEKFILNLSSHNRLLRILNISSLSLSSEYAGVVNLTERLYAHASDIPAGYCHCQSCDIVGPAPVAKSCLCKMKFERPRE